MSDHVRIFWVFALVSLASGAASQAQQAGRFNRVSTASRVQRGSTSSASRATNVARSGGYRATEQAVASAGADSLHPFSSQAMAQAQGAGTGVPRFSTQQEPQPEEARPAQVQPRNYYPGMRAARAYQQPVALTARGSGIPMHICTPSRSMMMGGGHH